MFKVIGSNIEISAAECSIAFKFGTEFHHVTGDTLQMFKVKGQDHSVLYQQQKRYMAYWIGSATSNLAWRRKQTAKGLACMASGGSGLKLQCIRSCHVF